MPRAFLKAREPFSSYSHFIGAVLSGAGLFVLLVRLLFDPSVTGSLAAAAVVFCLSLIALYSASSVYHFSGRGEAVLRRLKKLGVELWLITGDNERTAQAVAAECDIEYVLSGVLPENKAEKVRELQSRGLKLAMVGDGINDAPALAAADTAIAMGGGTDVAIESSDITLLGGRLSAVPDALEVSRATMGAIRLNLAWALLYNVLSVGAAAFGVVNPAMAAAAMSLSSIAVLMNSLRLKKAVEKK